MKYLTWRGDAMAKSLQGLPQSKDLVGYRF
jgi:hypothetical protein